MCLITPFKDKKIATEDIVVYKSMNCESVEISRISSFKSAYWGHMYVVGELQPKVEMQEDNSYLASTSLEWNRVEAYAKEHLGFKEEGGDVFNSHITKFAKTHDCLICIGAGYHSYADKETAKESAYETWHRPSHLVKCIIPTGSEYYEGFGFIASNQIIITDDYEDL